MSERKVTALKLAIVASGRTTASIAAELGVDPSKVSRWSSGARQPKLADAQQLARILGTTVEELWPSQHADAGDRAAA